MLKFLSCLLVAAALGSAAIHAQATAFDVASVKPSDPNTGGPLASLPLVAPVTGGRFTANNVPLRLLVRVAYAVQDFQITGGPSWQLSQKFNIAAKMPDGTTPAALPQMLKALLADRFKLKLHTETKDMPVYSLVLARSDGKLGDQIKPSTADCSGGTDQLTLAQQAAKDPAALAARLRSGESIPCSMLPTMTSPGSFGMRANGQPIAALTRLLTSATGRIVQDKTGLTGTYDWTLNFDPQILLALVSQAGVNLPPGAASALPPSDSPALLTAIQEQLGLKLESARAPVEMLVIDSAEMPEAD